MQSFRWHDKRAAQNLVESCEKGEEGTIEDIKIHNKPTFVEMNTGSRVDFVKDSTFLVHLVLFYVLFLEGRASAKDMTDERSDTHSRPFKLCKETIKTKQISRSTVSTPKIYANTWQIAHVWFATKTNARSKSKSKTCLTPDPKKYNM